MGASASSPPSSAQCLESSSISLTLQSQSVCSSFSSSNVDQFGKEKKRKVATLSTLRKRFTRRRRTSKGFDHAQLFREFLNDWSPRDVMTLVEEYEATVALKEVTLQAELARPVVNTCKQDLGELFENKYCSDINLIYQGTVFQVHRAILAARCPFFREMLNSLSSICNEVAVDIDIAGVSVEMFNELLRYLYTGELSVSGNYEGNLDVLFQLSEQFGIPNPLEQDLRYLLETGIYSDISLTFSSQGDDSHKSVCDSSYICDHTLSDVERKPCKICHGTNEFWCHRAILSARSPFFRNVIHRQQRRSVDLKEINRTRIVLDENIIPRRYACILLRAVYQDTLDFNAFLENSKKGSMTDVHLPQNLVEEAMQLYEVARFIEMDALVQSCEDFIMESITLETLISVLQWSCQPHGSNWVQRQALNFIREEFSSISTSPILYQLDRSHLVEVIKSDFVQASELEVLQAVLKWGEHQLFKRVEEREPNLVSHTAHSVSRRGLRRRDLSDVELRDLISDLLGYIRIDHILPPDSEVLVTAVRRGLISRPPSYMLGDDSCIGHVSNIRPQAWIKGRSNHGIYVKPRLFTPYVEEAKVWLEEQLGHDTDIVRQQVWQISHIPDTLYMVEKPLSFSEGLVPLGHLCLVPPLEHVKDVVLDEGTLRIMKKREKELRQSPSARRAYSVVRNHCDVTKQLQLRVVREFGLPDQALELLHRAAYQCVEDQSDHCYGASLTPAHQAHYSGEESSHSYTHGRDVKPLRHFTLELGDSRESSIQQSSQFKWEQVGKKNMTDFQTVTRSCCNDHLNEIIPDIAMATSLMEQIHIAESEMNSETGGGFSLHMF